MADPEINATQKIEVAPAEPDDRPGMWEKWKDIAARAATFQARVLLAIFYWTIVPLFAIAVRTFSDPLQLSRKRGGRWTPAGRVDPWKQY